MTTLHRIGRMTATLTLTAAVGLAWHAPAYADTPDNQQQAASQAPAGAEDAPAADAAVEAPGEAVADQPEAPQEVAQESAQGPKQPAAKSAASTAAVASTCAPTTATATATITNSSAVLGGTVRLTGTGWCNPAGGGSTIGVKVDEGAISRLDSSVHGNKTIWTIIEADDNDGTFSVDIELPDGTSATSAPAFTPGEHTLRLLSGSLAAGDETRTVRTNSFTVTDGGTDPTAPAWAHELVTTNAATAWVEREVTSGGRLRLKGTGWTKAAGGASTLVVKLNISENGEQAKRTGSGILLGDDTIWALLDADDIAADGSFETSVAVPAALRAGQYFTVSLFTGKFASGDIQRTATTKPLIVDGVAWSGEEEGSDVTCVPTTDSPTVTIDTPSVEFGGTLTITGTGWCNPAGGGSRIGVKIDEGGISHLDSSVHANRTIWAIVQAKHSDGTFTADLVLPDGTTKTSAPALATGAHTLRLLSGSLLAGDQVRTLKSDEFVVGSYRPNGLPEPVTLRRSNRNGLEVIQKGSKLTVRVPSAAQGDWVHLSAYTSEGSPRHPWGETWFRTDGRGRITTRLPADEAVTGAHRLVAQSGNLGETGKLLGWSTVVFPGGTEDTQDTDETPKRPRVAPTSTAPTPTTTQAEELTQAPAPVPGKQLTRANRGRVTGQIEGSVLTLEVPAAEPGQVGFVTAYVGRSVVPIGGAVLDDTSRLLVDLGDLVDTELRLAIQDSSGELLGWYRHQPVADETPIADPVADPVPTITPTAPTSTASDDNSTVGALDAVLSGAGLTLLLAAWGVTALRRRGALT